MQNSVDFKIFWLKHQRVPDIGQCLVVLNRKEVRGVQQQGTGWWIVTDVDVNVKIKRGNSDIWEIWVKTPVPAIGQYLVVLIGKMLGGEEVQRR